MVTHWPGPASPQLVKLPDGIASSSRPAPCSAKETEPEQSEPVSFQLPWPPPYLYGLLAIWLPAAMMACTCGGAPAGATARPSAPTVALRPLVTAGAGGGGAAVPRGGGGGRARGAGGGDGAQRRDVVGVHEAVDRPLVRALELLDRLERARAELAVDDDVVARVAQEVLQHADVVPVHAALDGDPVAEALGPAPAPTPALAAGGGRAAVLAGDVGAAGASGGLQGRDRLAADGPARGERGGALEDLDRLNGRRTEPAVDLDGEAGLPQGLLKLTDIGPAGAGAKRAVA